MPFKFNPFSGNFDQTGSGGGASYIDGEEATYNDLSLDAGVAPLNSAWLVRSSSGIWPFNKPGGIYIRTATGGSSRDADYTYAGTMPDVFSDAVLTIYDEASTTRTGQFNLGSVTAGQNRVLTWPNANGTIARTEDFASPPAIGNTTRNTVAATTMSATGAITGAVAGTTSATSGCNGFQIPVPAAGGASAVGMYGTFSNGNQRAVIFGAGTSGSTATIADFSASGLALHDGTDTGTFVAAGKLTANRTYDLPNSSGTIALTAQLTDTQIFTANGTWTKPAGAKMVHFIVIGGGGGGGSGRRDNTSTDRCGGAGGGGGGISVGWLNASAFGSTETITVGAGGGGGAARTTNGNGNLGGSGGASSIGSVITTFASTGGGGGAGTSTGGGGGALNTARIYGPDGLTGLGENGSAVSNRGSAGTQFLGPSGGGGGGGISAANGTFTGGTGGTLGNARTSAIVVGGTSAASTAGGNGNSGGFNFTGSGGGGGSPDATTGAGRNGGNGGLYGGGGGGGSGGTAAENSGAGGNGADGIVIITTYL